MDAEALASSRERPGSDSFGNDENTPFGPPECDLFPLPRIDDAMELKRAGRLVRQNVQRDAQAIRQGAAVPVVPVEQLEDARGCPGRADPLLDTVSVDGIDHPDAAVLDEGVRATLHELVDDPAEPAAELVAKPGPHSAELMATP